MEGSGQGIHWRPKRTRHFPSFRLFVFDKANDWSALISPGSKNWFVHCSSPSQGPWMDDLTGRWIWFRIKWASRFIYVQWRNWHASTRKKKKETDTREAAKFSGRVRHTYPAMRSSFNSGWCHEIGEAAPFLLRVPYQIINAACRAAKDFFCIVSYEHWSQCCKLQQGRQLAETWEKDNHGSRLSAENLDWSGIP